MDTVRAGRRSLHHGGHLPRRTSELSSWPRTRRTCASQHADPATSCSKTAGVRGGVKRQQVTHPDTGRRGKHTRQPEILRRAASWVEDWTQRLNAVPFLCSSFSSKQPRFRYHRKNSNSNISVQLSQLCAHPRSSTASSTVIASLR